MLPHPSFDDVVSIPSWPDRQPVARLTPDKVGLDDDGFDVAGWWPGATWTTNASC
jgi:hypothetical protein